jgi:hypothetical protein
MTQTMDNPYPGPQYPDPRLPNYSGPGPQYYAGDHQAPPIANGAGDRAGSESMLALPSEAEPRGLWGFWLRLTGPGRQRTRDAAARERVRRGRLLSVMLLVTLIVVIAIFPKGFIPVLDYGTFGGIAIILVTLLICIPLNHASRVTAAGTIFCIGVSLALAWSLLATPNGLGMQDLPTFDLFALPIVIAGILLPRRAPFYFWIGCAAFIIADITFETRQANLAAYINQVGLYATVIIPLILTFVIAVVSWLGAGSVERAILEADRSADLEHAYRLIAEQKRRLEGAINMIQNVHARVANGDFSARAATAGGELMGLGVSLNLMLDRLSRLRGAETALTAIEQGGRRLAQYAWELGAGHLQSAPPQTGSPLLDAIGGALDQMRRTLYSQIAALATSLQSVTRSGDELVSATRALGMRTQDEGRQVSALHDTIQAMRSAAERAESSLAPPAEWLEQATVQGWADGAALAQTVSESLSSVRQTVALADQTPGAISQDTDPSTDRELFERAGAAERAFTDAIAQARALLARVVNQSGDLGPPRPAARPTPRPSSGPAQGPTY